MENSPIKKLHFVDQLRGFAVLGVLLVHVGYWFPQARVSNSPLFNAIIESGARGVQLFFIASAFTIYLSYSIRKQKEENTVYNFFVRRFFRIAPLYYTSILLYGYVFTYVRSGSPVSITNLFTSLAFINSLFPKYINDLVPGGWSISIEMIFYLFVPILHKKVNNLSKALLFLNATLILRFFINKMTIKFLGNYGADTVSNYLFFYLPNQLPLFALGIVLYFIYKGEKTITIFSLLLVSFLFYLNLLIGNQLIPHHIQFGIFFIFFAILLFRIPELKILNLISYIGKVSFSMYLVHFAVLECLKQFAAKYYPIPFSSEISINCLYYILLYLILISFSLIISSITYAIIEKQGIKLGNNFLSKIQLVS